jgi:hypothetical protein
VLGPAVGFTKNYTKDPKYFKQLCRPHWQSIDIPRYFISYFKDYKNDNEIKSFFTPNLNKIFNTFQSLDFYKVIKDIKK